MITKNPPPKVTAFGSEELPGPFLQAGSLDCCFQSCSSAASRAQVVTRATFSPAQKMSCVQNQRLPRAPGHQSHRHTGLSSSLPKFRHSLPTPTTHMQGAPQECPGAHSLSPQTTSIHQGGNTQRGLLSEQRHTAKTWDWALSGLHSPVLQSPAAASVTRPPLSPASEPSCTPAPQPPPSAPPHTRLLLCLGGSPIPGPANTHPESGTRPRCPIPRRALTHLHGGT